MTTLSLMLNKFLPWTQLSYSSFKLFFLTIITHTSNFMFCLTPTFPSKHQTDLSWVMVWITFNFPNKSSTILPLEILYRRSWLQWAWNIMIRPYISFKWCLDSIPFTVFSQIRTSTFVDNTCTKFLIVVKKLKLSPLSQTILSISYTLINNNKKYMKDICHWHLVHYKGLSPFSFRGKSNKWSCFT